MVDSVGNESEVDKNGESNVVEGGGDAGGDGDGDEREQGECAHGV